VLVRECVEPANVGVPDDGHVGHVQHGQFGGNEGEIDQLCCGPQKVVSSNGSEQISVQLLLHLRHGLALHERGGHKKGGDDAGSIDALVHHHGLPHTTVRRAKKRNEKEKEKASKMRDEIRDLGDNWISQSRFNVVIRLLIIFRPLKTHTHREGESSL